MPFQIIVADSDEMIRKSVESSLLREGYKVESAHNYDQLRSLVSNLNSAVILITRSSLLGGNQKLFIEQLHSKSSESKVIFIAEEKDKSQALSGLKAGVFDFLIKPLDLLELNYAIKRCLRHSSDSSIQRVQSTLDSPNSVDSTNVHPLRISSYSRTTSENIATPGAGATLLAFPSSSQSFSDSTASHENSYTDLKKKWCDSFERQYLITLLHKTEGNVSAAAREAKLDRSNFLRLLRRHGLKSNEYRKAA